MAIALVPKDRARRYECFADDCGEELLVPFSLDRCPSCGEEDDFYLMN